MRSLLTLALALGLCGLAGALDDKKTDDKKLEEKKAEEKPSVADQIKAIEKEFQETANDLGKQFQAAKTDEEKAALREKFFALQPKVAEKALAIAEANLKDPAAIDAALLALKMGGPSPVGTKAGELIGANFADSPKLKPLIPSLGRSAGGQKLLKVIHEKATDKDVKGATLYYIASGMLEEADYPRGGPPVPADKQAAAFKEAGEMLAKVSKEYGDVQIGGRRGEKETLAKAVENQLFFLNNLTVGKVLPDSVCEDLDGKKVKISDYRGKVVVLDIWATWCGPCRAMIPHERELVKNLKDKPFVFISLSADDEKDTLVKFIEKEPMPWTHWWNGGAKGGPVADYKVQFFPTVYVLDEKGVIRFKHVREKAMDEAIDVLLKEIKPKG
ncbi:thiol-disulfide isomerase-like thioredoxin : Thioredoxin family protein OS=uncultured marine group II/III euryarchaeote KM3_170_G02 PE=4 SV=1: AhpC-TSA [Gemmataceae bacterium]|nr:thiol-disulfide isomerase-like thioredoxin : Thioredoxin family protein OS=uncultured marine group II/III euryarchaeote KM3_170_G02 PE=4 SV=1: AhpC-TSA [Gemmataceae bacterium]VTT97209.1 thiol-disulfide isomerase-like thioredoxin : Thioredoxin family protein OS=uncultured marine group II/III euryarchaeote KM3_170_G02 PE=4 SV=1: AhpC-TSA [Gemmataceae bacterium]